MAKSRRMLACLLCGTFSSAGLCTDLAAYAIDDIPRLSVYEQAAIVLALQQDTDLEPPPTPTPNADLDPPPLPTPAPDANLDPPPPPTSGADLDPPSSSGIVAPDFRAPEDVIIEAPAPVRKPRPVLPSVDFSTLHTPQEVASPWDSATALGAKRRWWDPYHGSNPLKGDVPVYAQDWFFNLGLASDTRWQSRYVPLPNGLGNGLGDGAQQVYRQNLRLDAVVYKGATAPRPSGYAFRFSPVFNVNKIAGEQAGVLNAFPGAGDGNGTDRSDDAVGIQALFGDVRLRHTAPQTASSHSVTAHPAADDDGYDSDSDSIRVGVQPFNADFRGFLFHDQPFGIRLFGSRYSNVIQYNLAWFRRLEKDSNSGLNDIGEGLRKDDVLVASVYWRDLLALGLTTQFSFTHNRNRENGVIQYDSNGFLVRPAPLFAARSARDYDVSYLGWSNDGHVGRVNISSSLYYAIGSGDSEVEQARRNDIAALFAALETSYDIDWIRLRLSYLYASGDPDPYDDVSQGFDAIYENPLFAGAGASYHIGQALPLIGGGGVVLSGRDGLLNALRSSKEQGQANFTNPGLVLLGLGADVELWPELSAMLNVNKLAFDNSAVLQALRQQAGIADDIGVDVSLALFYRPWLNQNFIAALNYSRLLPGKAFDDLYAGAQTPFAFTLNLLLRY